MLGQRSFVVVLCVAVLALIGVVVTLGGVSSSTNNKPASHQQTAALESAAIARLHFPASFVRVEHGCKTGRCYVVDGRSAGIVAMMPGLLRSAGFQPVGSLRAAEPIAMLKASHWTTGSSDPLVIACRTIKGSGLGSVTECQDAARIGQTLVNVLVGPYPPTKSSNGAVQIRTGILVWAVAFPAKS